MVDDNEFDLIIVSSNAAIAEEPKSNTEASSRMTSQSSDPGEVEIMIPDRRESIELYAWNVIIGMVCLQIRIHVP